MERKKHNFKIIKKAYEVVDPTVWETYEYRADRWENSDIVFAETAGEAKRLCRDYEEFINIRVRRAKHRDIVEYEGREKQRSWVLYEIAEAEKATKRKAALAKLPDNEIFYVQDGRNYVGNSVLWWAKGCSGYTTDINNAEKFTKEDVIKQFSSGRETDSIWVASHVEANIKTHVDMQYLKREYRLV